MAGPEAQASAGISWSGTRQHSSREGVLVPTNPSPLTRRRRKWNLAACRGLGRKAGPVAMAATGDVRGYAHELGARKTTPPPGDSARRSFGRCSTRTAPGPRSGRHLGYGPACLLRGVVAMPKLEHRRQTKLHPRICRRPLAEGGSAPSEGPQGLSGGVLGNRTVQRCSFRESVAEVGEVHLSGQNGLRGNS